MVSAFGIEHGEFSKRIHRAPKPSVLFTDGKRVAHKGTLRKVRLTAYRAAARAGTPTPVKNLLSAASPATRAVFG